MWMFWVIMIFIFAAAEFKIKDLSGLCFAIGSAVSLGLSFITDSGLILFIVFVVVSLLGLFIVKKASKSKDKASRIPAHLEGFIGQTATVIEDIDTNGGGVMLNGQMYTAILKNRYEKVYTNQKVLIVGIDSFTLIVEKIKK